MRPACKSPGPAAANRIWRTNGHWNRQCLQTSHRVDCSDYVSYINKWYPKLYQIWCVLNDDTICFFFNVYTTIFFLNVVFFLFNILSYFKTNTSYYFFQTKWWVFVLNVKFYEMFLWHVSLQAAAENKLSDLKEKSALGMQYAVHHHNFIDLDIDVAASYIIVPQTGVYRG